MSTFSVVCGTRACNAKCPFCISRMTAACADEQPSRFDFLRLEKACRYVVNTDERRTQTALITGRGEPTLFSDHLHVIVGRLDQHFANIELQTNGVLYRTIPWLDLQQVGLNTISISVASLNDALNNEVMGIRQPFSARECIKTLAEMGFTLRVSYQLTLKDGPYERKNGRVLKRCQSNDWFYNTIKDAQDLGAQQITFRRVGQPQATPQNQSAYDWVEEFGDTHNYKDVFDGLGRKISTYHWGGMIYDVEGMSVCLAECLTENPETFEPRSWIFDGKHLRYSWQYEGAIIF